MLKIVKKVLFSIVSLLLAFLLLWCAVVWSYYPHYSKNQKEILVNETYNTDEIKIMSYNIRCHAPDDMGEKNWFNRAHLVADTIEKAQPGIIGFQEVNSWQYEYLCESMPDFDSIITFRDNIPIYSEGCPVFYRTDLYTLVDKGSFWLSETPDEMSKDWGAACYRICSYVKLKDNATNNEFLVFNAHLDHISDEARINGINVVLDKIKEFG
jgi:endonuclease/exonuclease/phosphatase family metal-dependent hydrolase